MRGGGSPAGRLGKRTAARAPGLARPSAGRGNAAGAAETRAHLVCVNSALSCVRRQQRRPPDQAAGLAAFIEAIAAGAAAGMNEHDRRAWGLLGASFLLVRAARALLPWDNICHLAGGSSYIARPTTETALFCYWREAALNQARKAARVGVRHPLHQKAAVWQGVP